MSKKTSKKLITQETLQWVRENYEFWVDDTYDDPCDVGNCAKDYQEWIERAVRIGEDIGVSFEQVVKGVASEYEIKRFDERCTDEYWE